MKNRLFVCSILTYASIMVTGFAFAELDSNKVYQVKDMTVTASRYDETIASVPANVTIVSQRDIENATARDIPEMLRDIAGVHVNDITGNRRNYTVDLRGFGETAGLNTLVLVDGRRSNQADLSGTDWSQISLDRVERIEIIRGGRASVIYGDNAAGGVVNIITKKGKAFRAGAEFSGGSYDTYMGNAFISGTHSIISYAINGSYLDSDGYRDNSETEAKDIGADLGIAMGEIGSFNFSFGYHKDDTSLPGALKSSDFAAGVSREDTLFPNDFADTEDYFIKVGPEIHIFKNSFLKIDLSYRGRDVTNYASGDWGYFDSEIDIETVTVNPQIVLREKLFGKQNNLTLGVDYTSAKEDIANTSEYSGWVSQATVDMEKENSGYYIHNELMLIPKLGLSAGYRFDRSRFEYDTSAGTPSPDHVTFDEELYTIGVNYQLNRKSNMYISYSTSFRYPVMDELFNFMFNSVDLTLSPQTSKDIEVGIRHNFTDTFRMGINLFNIDTEDEIFYNREMFANQNLDGDVERQGVEISLEKGFKWGSATASYTFTKSEIDGGTYDGRDFPNVPEHQAGMKAVIDMWKPFTLVVNGTYVGKRPFVSDFRNTFNDQDDYIVVNAGLKYRWKKITAFMDINNLFDEDYSEYGVLGGFPVLEEAFYPSKETNFLLGVKIEI